ncbi:MAG: nuclear transport factor 2 family protein [Halioglobus sp.]
MATQCDSCAIKNLIYQYADHIDRGDLRAVAAMFSRGRIVAADSEGRENEFVGEESVYHTKHMTTNVMVELDDSGRGASTQAYCIVFQALADFPLQPVIAVRYRDRFEKTGQGWHFTERRMETELLGDLSRHLLQAI